MDYQKACDSIDLMHDAGIKQVNLLGGEPTCYPPLLDLIKYCSRNDMETCLVTNGIRLSDCPPLFYIQTSEGVERAVTQSVTSRDSPAFYIIIILLRM